MTQGVPPPPSVCNGFLYTVVPGDTLFFVAQRFGVSLQGLIAANPQITNPNLIFPGQVICVPTGVPGIPTIECSMLLFRTANVPGGPDTGGVARVFQSPIIGGNFLIATIGLPPPQMFGRNVYVAFIRSTVPGRLVTRVPLLQTGPVVIEPGVWVGAFIFGPGEQFAPFEDIVVTAEESGAVLEPDLSRIVLIGRFEQCGPQ